MRTVALRYLSATPVVNGLGLPGSHDNREWPRYVRTSDIATPTSLRDDVFASQPPDIARQAPLLKGDIVMTAAGSIGRSTMYLSDEPACFAGFLTRFRPNSQAEGRFVLHWMQSKHYWDQVLTGAVKSTIENFSASRYRSLEVPLHGLDEQRRIADFLDDRVAHIDNIIAARQRQAALASTMPWRKFDEAIKETDLPQAPFRRFIRFISDGPFGSAFSSADYTDNGAAVIRLGNIGFAKFHGEDVARIPSHIYSQFPRCQVQPGELLIASLGDENNHAGRACIAPTGLGPAMVKGKCYRAITNSNIATAEFVQICLSSGTGRAALATAGTGATRNMVNLDRLQSTRLPLPPLEQQRDFAENFREHERDTGRLTQSLTRFIKLLTEYKQSLITAAVTGQLDVTTASTRIPE